MPHYKKVFDIGTYTGNGGQYRVGIPTLRGVGPTGTQVAGSTRWRSSAPTYLSRTPASAGNRKTWTWSFWIKRGALGTNQEILVAYAAANDAGNFEVRFSTTDQLFLYGWSSTWRTTTQVFKDTSTWQHIIIAADTTLATANDRIKIYVNGAQITSFATITNPTQNADLGVNSAAIHRISGNSIPDGLYFDGYLSQMYMIDGQALTPSSFGEYNSDGIWVPKTYSGTYGTTGFYLPMNSSANYATDQSGNGNNWTPTGFNVTTSNTTFDLVTDSPTDYGTDTGAGAQVRGNYCTWDPNTKGSTITLSSGNLGFAVGAPAGLVCPATFTLSSGKWFWEILCVSGTHGIGVARQGYTASMSYIGIDTTSWGWYSTLGKVYNNTFTSAYGTYTNNDVIGVALDADVGSITFYKNGVSFGAAFTGMTGPYIPIISVNGAATGFANFGQRAFSYAAPSGFKAICTANIDRPTDSSLWFYGDTPDLMWIKNRSTTGLNTITDTVRGTGLNLITSSTAAETSYPAVTEMNKFGMTVINDGTSIVNGSTNSHVYWAWKAGSNTSSTSVTNTDGTITSQVSVNRQAGFSIVSWTGTGASSASVGHGLGTGTPNFVIIKKRNATEGWYTCHSSSGQGLNYAYHLFLNTTGALVGSNDPYLLGSQSNDNKLYLADGTSSNGGNQSGINYVAYCWTAIPGYSAFGSYAGNGAADGPFVYTGFSPRWLMVKSITAASASNWCIYDVVRQTYNQLRNPLYANATNAEPSSGIAFDIVSNGFKLREGGGQGNDSGVTYIYAAFAETPFKFARAR